MQSFIDCIKEQMIDKRFGEKRAKRITDRFTNLAEDFKSQGDPQFAFSAMRQVLDEEEKAIQTKARLQQSDLAKMAERKRRLEVFDRNKALISETGTKSVDEGRPVIGMLEGDPRSGGVNYFDLHDAYVRRLWALANDSAERMGRGVLGIRKSKAYEQSLVRELLGEHTGDKVAQELARGVRKALDAGVDMFNAAGGAMEKLDNYLPQKRSKTKVFSAGREDWIRSHSEGGRNPVDWNRMRYPDGSSIPVARREEALSRAYDTLTTDGRSKQDPEAGRGTGSSTGNKLEEHRFIIYKDADAWLAAHEAYGEGTILDVLHGHFSSIAKDTAMVSLFGSNPKMGYEQTKRMALARADALGEKGAAEAAQATLAHADKMFDNMSGTNPMNQESITGHMVTGASNVLTSALLGSVPLVGIADDFSKMGAMRLFNKMDLRPLDFLNSYMKIWATDRAHMESMLTQTGLIAKEVVEANYAAQRYGSVATYAPSITRKLSDWTMRASGMAGHTKAAQGGVQAEIMAFMAREADKEFAQLQWAPVMQRYGITPADWDQLRALDKYDFGVGKNHVDVPQEKRSGANWLRPIDALNQLGEAKGQPLFEKFQTMLLRETRYFIPESSVEAQVALKGTTRPDTLAGAVLHSFSMYKNFPVTQQLIYGRLAMSSTNRTGRLSFIAGLGVSMLGVGALAVQLKELAKGRDPLPMNTPEFFGKAMMTGGALGMYGDYLFSGVNEYGTSGATQMAGPIFGTLSDAAAVVRDDPLAWISEMSAGKALHHVKAGGAAVNLMKHYTPGTSLWWARLALEREVWDRLAEHADPKAYNKMSAAVQRARKAGNDYYWRPGTEAPQRMPSFGGTP